MTRRTVYGLGLLVTFACELKNTTEAILTLEGQYTNIHRHGYDNSKYRHAPMDQL